MKNGLNDLTYHIHTCILQKWIFVLIGILLASCVEQNLNSLYGQTSIVKKEEMFLRCAIIIQKSWFLSDLCPISSFYCIGCQEKPFDVKGQSKNHRKQVVVMTNVSIIKSFLRAIFFLRSCPNLTQILHITLKNPIYCPVH